MKVILMIFACSVTTHSFVVKFGVTLWGQYAPHRTISTKTRLLDTESEDQDWREFRAKLIMQEEKDDCICRADSKDEPSQFGHHDQETVSSKVEVMQDGHLSWLHEQKMLEQGSLLLHTPRPQDVSGLGRQYLYQSVILILESSPNDETIGIILNRPTEFALNDNEISQVLHFGGDEYSSVLSDPDPRIYVLHHPESEMDSSSSCGFDVLPGLSIMNMMEAQNFIETRNPNIEEFTTYSGHVVFDTFALQAELKADIWTCLSVDSSTLRTLLTKQQRQSISTHNVYLDEREATLRDNLLQKAGLSHKISSDHEKNEYNHSFDRRMFEAWRKLHFQVKEVPRTESNDLDANDESTSSSFQAGDLLFSFASDFLFYDQEFRKSLVMILQDDDELTVGVLLSHPSTKMEPTLGLPIRYGGNFQYLAEEPDDGDSTETELPPFCLHYLGGLVGGEPMGDFFYKASIEDAAQAIEAGVASPEDFLVIQGMTVWPKGDSDCCGLSGSFQKIDPIENSQVIWDAWKTLGSQEALSPLHMESNIDIARNAWNIAVSASKTNPALPNDNDEGSKFKLTTFFDGSPEKRNNDPKSERPVYVNDENSDLGFDAVKTWLACYLLDDPDYRP